MSQPDRTPSAAPTPCSICLGSGRVFRYHIVDPRDVPTTINVTHAAPIPELCPNCKGAGRV